MKLNINCISTNIRETTILVLLFFWFGCQAQTYENNYIRTITFLNKNATDSIISIQYYDGLGRPNIKATNGLSGQGKYIYTLQEYNSVGLESKSWNAVVGGNSLTCPSSQEIEALSTATYNDNSAFSNVEYDALRRKTSLTKGGDLWQGKKVTTFYSTNTNDEVKNYSVGSGTVILSDSWPAGALTCETVTDEDGHYNKVYKNLFGDIVMGDNAGKHTYYIYNERGLLQFVLTPQYQTSNNLQLDAYEYKYDQFDRIASKRLPGCEPTTYNYDNADRIITEQTPLLREKGRMRFYLYDALGRLCVQGTCLQETINLNYATTSYSSVNSGLLDTGYSSPYYYKNAKLELAYYYDSYIFFYSPQFRNFQNVSQLHTSNFPEAEQYAKGSKTGEAVMTSDGKLLLSSYYYNQKGNVISEGHSNYDSTVRKVFTEYSFTDKPTKVTKVYMYGSYPYSITTNYTYNKFNDCLEKTTITSGDNSVLHTVSQLTYDDLGRVNNDNKPEINDNISYSYDLHGWTTDINGKFFSEKLCYATGPYTPCYNGNISSQFWMATDSLLRGYRYRYDNCNLLYTAIYGEGDALFLNTTKYAVGTIRYTENNAIKSIARRGMLNSGLYGIFDQLSYTYEGNKVINISDGIKGKLSYNNAFEYVDNHNGTTSDPDFRYNTSGMLTSDLDKGISRITYNDIGLTDSICFSNGSCINYVYSMTGEKLWVHELTVVPSIYSGGSGPEPQIGIAFWTYYGSDVKFVPYLGKASYLFDGGYIDIQISNSNTWPVTQYYYYAKDHLGNIRSVVTKNSQGVISEVQTTHYYPFGGIIADISTGRYVQDRLYNGKELDTSNNLWWYDYGARQYDPAAPRFTTPDPLAEKYYDISPYAYCHNNPVNRVDPDGRDDYYDCFGNFLGSNNNETDYIYIADKFRPLGEWSGQNHYGIISKMPLADAELSAKAWSKILTNTISIMEDVDVKELEGGAVSVLKVSPGNGNTIDGEAFNNPDNSYEYGENASQINNKITAKIGFANENMFSTRSNIQNMLGVEEYLEHMKKGLSHFNKDGSANDKNNIKIFNDMMRHSTWLKATPAYRNSIINYKNKLLGR